MGIVIDASLLAAIALNEPRQVAVRRAFRAWDEAGEHIDAPSLLHYELASALSKSVSRGATTTEAAGIAWRKLQILPVTFHDMRDEVLEMVETASALQRRSSYDAAYLVLAKRLSAELFTLDGSLYRNASELGHAINLIE